MPTIATWNINGVRARIDSLLAWLKEANPDIVPLCVIDRETIVGATKFVLCQRAWFERYQTRMLEIFEAQLWPLGADFEPHWCLVLSQDTRLAEIV